MPDDNDPFELSDPLLATLKDQAVRIDEPRMIEHCFFCKNAESVKQLFSEVSKLGLELGAGSETEESEDIDEGSYALICKEIARPDQMTDRAEQLEEIAEKFDCSYDGWGTAV